MPSRLPRFFIARAAFVTVVVVLGTTFAVVVMHRPLPEDAGLPRCDDGDSERRLWRCASACVGAMFGLLPAAMHVPNDRGGCVFVQQLWARALAATLACVPTLALVSFRCVLALTADQKMQIIPDVSNIIMCALISALYAACLARKRPPSCYVNDAMWCIGAYWASVHMMSWRYVSPGPLGVWGDHKEMATRMWEAFCQVGAFHVEGVAFVWNACLMLRRATILGSKATALSRGGDTSLIVATAVCFQAKMWAESTFEMGKALDFDAYLWVYSLISVAFLGVWLFYFGFAALCMARAVRRLREAGRIKGIPEVETMWARKVLFVELLSCLTIGLSTFTFGGASAILRVMTWFQCPPASASSLFLVKTAQVGHRLDLIVSALCIALLSGLIWQPQRPKAEGEQPRIMRQASLRAFADENAVGRAADDDADSKTEEWMELVKDLANRGVKLSKLLEFWEDLFEKKLELYPGGPKVMECFDANRSTTNDVVRMAIIPLSRNRDGDKSLGGGEALASKWKGNEPLPAECMVTHTWSGLFLHLLAGVFSIFLDGPQAFATSTGERFYGKTMRLLLDGQRGCERIRAMLKASGTLERAVWICAFSVNQHRCICQGFGDPDPERPEEYERRKRATTGDEFTPCDCGMPKVFSGIGSEMNKFDDMMAHLRAEGQAEGHRPFGHVVVVDAAFQVFGRIWCIAEIAQSTVSQIPQRIVMHSQLAFDTHFPMLVDIDVEKCQAARAQDRDDILAKIGRDTKAFNRKLQCSIFGLDGLLQAFVDGQQRVAMIARLLRDAL